jgi:hypothetical protein
MRSAVDRLLVMRTDRLPPASQAQHLGRHIPGAYAPGFMLSPAPQAAVRSCFIP